MKKFGCRVLILAVLLLPLSGCGSRVTPEKRAEEIVTKVLTLTMEQREGYTGLFADIVYSNEPGISRNDRVPEYFAGEYGSLLTEKCIEKMAADRSFPLANSALLDIGADVLPQNVRLTPSGADLAYSAELWANDRCVATAEGVVVLSAEKPQKASSLTVRITVL